MASVNHNYASYVHIFPLVAYMVGVISRQNITVLFEKSSAFLLSFEYDKIYHFSRITSLLVMDGSFRRENNLR